MRLDSRSHDVLVIVLCVSAAGRASWIVELRKWEKDWKAKQERWLQTKGKVLAEDWDRLFLGEASIATRVRRRKRAPEDEEDLDITPDIVMPKVKELVRVRVRACVCTRVRVLVLYMRSISHLRSSLGAQQPQQQANIAGGKRKREEAPPAAGGQASARNRLNDMLQRFEDLEEQKEVQKRAEKRLRTNMAKEVRNPKFMSCNWHTHMQHAALTLAISMSGGQGRSSNQRLPDDCGFISSHTPTSL